ncbi:MAG: hypothetical protein UZ01_02998 [Candidatus Brocadia sinica]|nr:MAG: hypothetical protein UZ01_02998 [Candidatus Brocadia sinica]GIK12104.1 MAG: hypothetical protein BroJett002_08110 [Candidatus Brocadia sinica]
MRNFKAVVVERRDSSLYIEKVVEDLIHYILLSLQVDNLSQYFISSGDDLCVKLKAPLRRNQ